jgi:predicted RNA-binding protein with PIN domain
MKNSKEKILIIDGYNAIHAAQDRFRKISGLEQQRNHFLRILNSSTSFNQYKVVVVFDGQTQSPSGTKFFRNNVQVIYTGAGREADDVIQDILRKKAHQSQLEIVSSDNRVRNTANDHSVTAIRSEQFWQMIQPRSKKKKGTSEDSHPSDRQLSKKELNEWLRIFRNRSKNNDDL